MRTTRHVLASLLVGALLALGACSDDSTTTPEADGGLKPDKSVIPDSDGQVPLDTQPDTAPPPKLCERAEELTLKDGSVRVVRSATWLLPLEAEPKCAGSAAADAPKMLFKFAATKDQWYRVLLDARFDAYMYLFTNATCTVADIEADCTSGTTGDKVGPISGGSLGLAYIKAPADGDIFAVIKAAAADPEAFFAFTVEEIKAPTNGTCAAAQAMPFFNGKAAVVGDTQAKLTPDEFSGLRCGSSADLDGPQAYYSFTAKKGVSYKIAVNPTFEGRLYVFTAATSCTQADIETDCASNGATGKFFALKANQANDAYFVAQADGDYKIAIDSEDAAQAGSFALGIEEDVVEPPDNERCADAKPVVFNAGKASFLGTTIAAVNEFGTTIDCGGVTDLDGPQVYYKLKVQANKGYKITLSPSFSSYFYVFKASSCGTGTLIDADCATKGAEGLFSKKVSSGDSKTLFFRPTTPGDYLVAVDSSSDTIAGNFNIDFAEIDPPSNATCAAAKTVPLTSGAATIKGTTAFSLDEHSGLTCSSSTALDGPQVYHSITLTKDKLYKIELTPAFADSFMYVFRKASGCTQNAIQTDCSAGGASGSSAGPLGAGNTGAVYIVPTATEDYIIAVDSSDISKFGDFEITITETTPGTNTTCAAATQLTLKNNTATAIGITTGAANEFGSTVTCGGNAMEGAQNYYKISMVANTKYYISITADFAASVYVFSPTAACGGAAIDTDCASAGVTGDVRSLPGPGSMAFTFTPTTAGDYVIAVDARNAAASGAYTLQVADLFPRVLIDEINVGSNDYVVLRNTGSLTAQLAGMEFILYTTNLSAPDNAITFSNLSLAPGATLYLVETSSPQPGDIYIGGNIFYGGGSSFNAMLCQGPCATTSNAVDFAQFGNSPPTPPTGITFTGGGVTGITYNNESTTSYIRKNTLGTSPTFLKSDWATGPATR